MGINLMQALASHRIEAADSIDAAISDDLRSIPAC
jgi:hypothetical protein